MVTPNDPGSDSWHQHPTPAGFSTIARAAKAGHTSAATRRPAPAVPDDWDADDADDDNSDGQDNNQHIWDQANARAPMPDVVAVKPAGSSTPSVVPPAAALQAPLRILKRPSPHQTTPSPSPAPDQRQSHRSLAEREARYQAARERIFGENGHGKDHVHGQRGVSSQQLGSNAIRNPRGPTQDLANGVVPVGFGGRRKKDSVNAPVSCS